MKFIIFDTNAIRNLVKNKDYDQVREYANSIKKNNIKCGYKVIIDTTVTDELISHFLDNSDRARLSVRKGILLLSIICETKIANPTPQLQLSREFYGKYINYEIDNINKKVGFVMHLGNLEDATCTDDEINDIKKISNFISKGEDVFVNMIGMLIHNIDSSTKNWQVFLKKPEDKNRYKKYIHSNEFKELYAKVQVDRICNLLIKEGQINPNEGNNIQKKDGLVRQYIDRYQAPMDMLVAFMEKFVECDFNLSKKKERANYMWDMNILHAAGKKIKGYEIIIISNDKALLKAAKTHNLKSCVYTLNEYLKNISMESIEGIE